MSRPLLVVASMVALASLMWAHPAQGTVTPINSRVSATSTNTAWVADDGSASITCPTAALAMTVSGDGLSLSGTFSYSRGRARTCTAATPLGIVSISDGTCVPVTLRSSTSTSGVNASFDLTVDVGSACRVTVPGLATLTLDSQTAVRCVTFSQASQSVSVDCSLRYTSTFGGPGVLTFTGTFSVLTPRLTLS